MLEFMLVKDFVTSLASTDIGKRQKSLVLYAHLLKQTDAEAHPTHACAHVEHFRDFCFGNRSAIEQRAAEKLDPCVIEHSPRTRINVQSALQHADASTQKVIWDHLDNLLYVFDHPDEQETLASQHTMQALEKLVETVQKSAAPLVATESLDTMEGVQNVIAQLAQSGMFEQVAKQLSSTFQDMTVAQMFEILQSFCAKMAPEADMNKILASMQDPAGLGMIMATLGAQPDALGNILSGLQPKSSI